MTAALRRRTSTSSLVTLAAALVLTGCAKGDPTQVSDSAGGNNAAGKQVVKAAAADTPTCTLEQYGVEKIDLKDAVVGFSQSEKEANPFRIAETQSIKDEAERVGVKKLLTTNANSQLSKQISDIQDMLAQGAQALIVAPLNSEGLQPALNAAKDKGVPVLTIDRKVNAQPCEDYLAFIGSNFTEQGKRAADALIKATGGKGKVAILLGSSGNNVTTERTKGFVDRVEAKAPGLEIVAQQTGDFARDKGQQVMEQILQANPDVTAVYAENDEMGLGALVAINGAGKTAGEDIKIVSIDGTRNAVQEVVDGTFAAVIESNPRFGPVAFQTLENFYGGEAAPVDIVIEDKEYTPTNAEDEIDSAY